MLNGGFYFIFCLAKELFCSSAEAQAVTVSGGCSAAGHSVLIQTRFLCWHQTWWVFISHLLLWNTWAGEAGGVCRSLHCGLCVRRCWLLALAWVGNCYELMCCHLLLPHHSYLHQNYKIMDCWSFMLCSCSLWHRGLVCVGDLRPRAGGECVWDSPRTVPVSRGPRLCVLSDPQAPHGAPLLLLQLEMSQEESSGGGGSGFWVSGAGRDLLKEPSGPHLVLCGFTRGPFRGVAAWAQGFDCSLTQAVGWSHPELWSLEEPFLLDWRCPSVCIPWQCATCSPSTAPWLQCWICDVHAWRRGW